MSIQRGQVDQRDPVTGCGLNKYLSHWWLPLSSNYGEIFPDIYGRVNGPMTGGFSPFAWQAGLRAVRFNGSNGQAVIPFVGTLSTTWMFWVWLPETGSDGGAFIKIGSGSDGLGVGIGGTTFDNTGSQLITLREAIAWQPTGYIMSPGWTHIAIHIGGPGGVGVGAYAIFVNGVRVGTFSDFNIPTNQTYLGGYTGSAAENRFVSCAITDLRYFTAILDEPQPMQQYLQSRAAHPNTLRWLPYPIPGIGSAAVPGVELGFKPYWIPQLTNQVVGQGII